MSSSPPDVPKRAPERTCVGCGTKKQKTALIRLALSEDGQVVIDEQNTAPGRGAWLCGPGCLRSALKRKAFGRAFRGKAAPLNPEVMEAHLSKGAPEGSGDAGE